MNIQSDLWWNILPFVSKIPILSCVCRHFKEIYDKLYPLIEKDVIRKYQYWQKSNRVHALNLAAINGDWDDFLILLKFMDNKSDAQYIALMYKRFNIIGITMKYRSHRLIDLPELYYMWMYRDKYPDIEQITINYIIDAYISVCGDSIYDSASSIGFIHPDMRDFIINSYHDIIEIGEDMGEDMGNFYLPLVISDNPREIDLENNPLGCLCVTEGVPCETFEHTLATLDTHLIQINKHIFNILINATYVTKEIVDAILKFGKENNVPIYYNTCNPLIYYLIGGYDISYPKECSVICLPGDLYTLCTKVNCMASFIRANINTVFHASYAKLEYSNEKYLVHTDDGTICVPENMIISSGFKYRQFISGETVHVGYISSKVPSNNCITVYRDSPLYWTILRLKKGTDGSGIVKVLKLKGINTSCEDIYDIDKYISKDGDGVSYIAIM